MAAVKVCVPCGNGNYHSRCRRKSHGQACACEKCFPEEKARRSVRSKPAIAADPTADHAYLSADARDTSVESRFAVLPNSGTMRWAVLMCLVDAGEEGLTDEEQREILGMRYSTQCARRLELEEGGWIEDSGRRRTTNAGNDAIVWTVSAEGEQRLKEEV